MKFNCVHRNSEATRDRFVRRALSQEPQDLYFARRKCGVLICRSLGCVCGDESNIRSFVHPRQSKSWDVGKQCGVIRSARAGSSTLIASTISSDAPSLVKSLAFRGPSTGPLPAYPLVARQA